MTGSRHEFLRPNFRKISDLAKDTELASHFVYGSIKLQKCNVISESVITVRTVF